MLPWEKTAVVYQIYPRSFYDTDGDGLGDLPGVTAKLDYLRDLGVNTLWLCPVYASPGADNGYDISDYCSVNPQLGTMEDMRALLREAKARGIRVIMDLVINHTSTEHEWFKQSRDPDSPYHEYYLWREGLMDGKLPPNNWTGFFGGGAWEKDPENGLYYLHLFAPTQADLNLKNGRVAEELINIMKFWLDAGVAGFRCDVINVIHKRTLMDGKRRLTLTGREHYLSTEGCHELLRRFNAEVFEPYGAFTVGETVMVTPAMANDLRAPQRKELGQVFSFAHMETDQINNKWFKTKFRPHKFFRVLDAWQRQVDWNANYLDNHDQPRAVSRFGDGKRFRYESATSLATVLFALRGTPYIYQGSEIGMTNGDFTGMADLRDTESFMIDGLMKKLRFPARRRWKMIRRATRDHARTPMQWTDEENGGFTEGAPWIKVNANAERVNAAREEITERSVLRYYRRLIHLRKTEPALIDGDYARVPAPLGVYGIRRAYADAGQSEPERQAEPTFRETVGATDVLLAFCSLSNKPRALFAPVTGELLAGNYFPDSTLSQTPVAWASSSKSERCSDLERPTPAEEPDGEPAETHGTGPRPKTVTLHTLRPYEAVLMRVSVQNAL